MAIEKDPNSNSLEQTHQTQTVWVWRMLNLEQLIVRFIDVYSVYKNNSYKNDKNTRTERRKERQQKKKNRKNTDDKYLTHLMPSVQSRVWSHLQTYHCFTYSKKSK
jgi:hypothetical protein